jgi:prepilin peptidase CpaA
MVFSQFTNNNLTIFLGLGGILFVAVAIDLRTQRIPNLLTFPAVALTLIYYSITNGLNGFLFSAIGLLAGISLLIVPYLLGGMGAGDAKLMGVVGGVLGAKAVFYAFLFSAIVGGIYAIILTIIYRPHFRGFYKKQLVALINFLLIRKYIPEPEDAELKKPRLCYGLAIGLGTGIYIVFNLLKQDLFS